MNSPLKWHGGKHYLVPTILKHVPPHLHRGETHGGSLAVTLALPCEGVSEFVNDRNADLTNFWRVLQNPELFPSLQRRLSCTPFSQVEWTDAGVDPTVDPVCRAANFFIRCRQSLAGRMTSFAPLSRTRVRRGMNEQVSAWLSAIDDLPEVHARLQRVVIFNLDATKLLFREDGPQTFFYVDPPYHPDTRTSPEVYAYEMTASEHQALANVLAGLKARVMLSHYRHPIYDALGWRVVEIDLPNNAAGGSTKRRMTECLYMNY